MTILLDITVPGKPHPLMRARSGNGRHYDPSENVGAKNKIQLFSRWSGPPTTAAVHIQIACHYMRATPTADVDNLAKTVLDALNNYVLKDDRQVISLHVYKRGSCVRDETLITVTEIAEFPDDDEAT